MKVVLLLIGLKTFPTPLSCDVILCSVGTRNEAVMCGIINLLRGVQHSVQIGCVAKSLDKYFVEFCGVTIFVSGFT